MLPRVELTNPSTCSHLAAVAVNSLDVPGGALYRFSGQLKTKDLVSAETTDGAIFSLFGYARSQALRGTTNWITVTRPHVTIPAGITSDVRLQTYGQVLTGDAWFANMSLQQEIPPTLQTFLLYPNYRGLMFSDESQVASVDLTINPLPGTSLNTLRVELDALHSTGHTVKSQTLRAAVERVHRHARHERLAAWRLQARRQAREPERQVAADAECLQNRKGRCFKLVRA